MTSTDSSTDTTTTLPEPNIVKKRVTNKEIEIWDVIQLDSNIEPVSKPSEVFDKLQAKRKSRHETILDQLKQDLLEVNKRTEKSIRMSSTEIKAHVKFFNDELSQILRSIDIPEVESYDGSVFLKFQNQASSFKSQQQKLVDDLYEDFNKFENERAEENEKLLRNACEEIQKIGYFSPYEVQTFVENETMKMNQLSLSNRRCYADLKLTLTLITEQTFKSFIDKVFCIREKWCLKSNEPCVSVEKVEEQAPKPPPEPRTRLELKGKELPIEPTPDNHYSICKPNLWFQNVQEVISSLENCARNLLKIYRKALDAIFCGFDTCADAVRSEINSIQSVAFEERKIQPLRFEGSTTSVREVETLETFWQETLPGVRALLNDAVEFLLDLESLWNRHVKRLCESKKLILKALEKAYETNQTSLQELEVKLNIGLDTLRQEYVTSKIEKAYETVVGVLNSIKTKLEGFYDGDIQTIQEYKAMLEVEAGVFSVELQEFIYAMHYIDVTKIPHRYSDPFRCFPEGKPILKSIYACTQQIKAISFWKQGAWAAMEGLSLKAKEALRPRGERWIRSKIKTLAAKKAVEIELLDKRFERIRLGVYETRKREVDLHKNTFDRHKEGIGFAIVRTNKRLETLTSRQMNELDERRKDLEEVEYRAKEETRAGVIGSTKIRLERRREDLEKKLRHSYGRFLADCESESSDLKTANINYIKNIKLFHEGGRYSSEEAKSFAGLLETIDKDIAAEFKSVSKNITKDESDVLKKCHSTFAPTLDLLSSLYEETFFFEKAKERMSDFLEGIGKMSESLKSDFELLREKTDFLFRVVHNPGQPIKEDLSKFWTVLLQSLYRNVSNLFYPMNLVQTPLSSSRSESQDENAGEADDDPCLCLGITRYSTQATASRTPTFRTAEIEDDLVCEDYKKDLFGTEDPPENDGTFMAVVSNAFWMEMDALQKLACRFYRKIQKRKIIREDLIPENYEMFADYVLVKFRFYNVQCEQLWIQTILDFLPLLGLIKQAANLYVERSLENYQNTTLESLKRYQEDFVACLESQTSEAQKQFKILDDKLLALHGSPKNKDLLSQLEEEVVRKTADLGIGWEAAVFKFKNSIRCFRLRELKDKEDIGKIQVQNFKITEKLFTEDLGNNLLNSITEHAKRGGFWTRKHSPNSSADEVRRGYRLDTSEILLDIQSCCQKLRNIVDNELSDEGDGCLLRAENSAESLNPCPPKLNFLLRPFDSETFVSVILEKLEQYLKEMKSLAKSKENAQEEDLFKWLEIWKFNVKKVEELYRVKNEKTPVEEKRVSNVRNGQKNTFTEQLYFLEFWKINLSIRKWSAEPPDLQRASITFEKKFPATVNGINHLRLQHSLLSDRFNDPREPSGALFF